MSIRPLIKNIEAGIPYNSWIANSYNTVGYAYDSYPTDFYVDGNGEVVVVSNIVNTVTTDIAVAVVRYSSSGAVIWSKKITDDITPENSRDAKIVAGESGNLYIAYITYSNVRNNYDINLLKIDSTGATIWIKGFDVESDIVAAMSFKNSKVYILSRSGYNSNIIIYDVNGTIVEKLSIASNQLQNFFVTSSDEIYVCGGWSANPGTTPTDGYIFKINANRTTNSHFTYYPSTGNTVAEYITDITIDSQGNIYFVLRATTSVVYKLNSSFTVLWKKNITSRTADKVLVDSLFNVYVTSTQYAGTGTTYTVYVDKFNAAGTSTGEFIVSSNDSSANLNTTPPLVSLDSTLLSIYILTSIKGVNLFKYPLDGSTLTGTEYVANPNLPTNTTLTSAAGTALAVSPLTTEAYYWTMYDWVSSGTSSHGRGIFSANYIYINPTRGYIVGKLIKLAKNLSSTLEMLHPEGFVYNSMNATASVLALDSSENIYQTIYDAAYSRYCLFKRSSVDGSISMAYAYSGLTENILNTKVDSSGNIYILTKTWLLKVNSAGTPQWLKRFTGGGGPYTLNHISMALDSTGNIYILVQAYNSTTNRGIGVIKVNSSGIIAWGTRWTNYNSYTEGDIVLDSSGNIYCAIQLYTTPGSGALLCFNNSGVLQWSTNLKSTADISCTAITIKDTNLYVGTSTGVLYKYTTAGVKVARVVACNNIEIQQIHVDGTKIYLVFQNGVMTMDDVFSIAGTYYLYANGSTAHSTTIGTTSVTLSEAALSPAVTTASLATLATVTGTTPTATALVTTVVGTPATTPLVYTYFKKPLTEITPLHTIKTLTPYVNNRTVRF